MNHKERLNVNNSPTQDSDNDKTDVKAVKGMKERAQDSDLQDENAANAQPNPGHYKSAKKAKD